FYQSLLDSATERIYTYLDLDFTASAVKTDIFWGRNQKTHMLHQAAGAVTLWTTTDEHGVATVMDPSKLHLFENGNFIVLSDGRFDPCTEHRITYTLPATLTCPETIRLVITEIAAIILRESKQGGDTLGKQLELFRETGSLSREVFFELGERHRSILSPYKRYAV
ncbi:MAG TPA: hypothetical protein VET48_03790, partial [Steroidobacteraceae bacterium]|nr:hypothetical protein [Steroidobacteraceae bacterium]